MALLCAGQVEPDRHKGKAPRSVAFQFQSPNGIRGEAILVTDCSALPFIEPGYMMRVHSNLQGGSAQRSQEGTIHEVPRRRAHALSYGQNLFNVEVHHANPETRIAALALGGTFPRAV
jgi:hypothetical protein